jgi:hypothetical protein
MPSQIFAFLNPDEQKGPKFLSKKTVPEFFRVPEKIRDLY